MNIENRTVFIAGGTSGIGRGLARRFAAAGGTVVVGGRRTTPVDGLTTVELDVTEPDSVRAARDRVLADHPGLDVVVTMSGVMLMEDLRDPAHFADAGTTVDTNLLGTIRVVLMHRWAERDGTYAELVAQRSGALSTLPGR
jgi:short-subunit dehydrogenase involved in D-alanine esterification of teichoic acids